MSVTLHTDLGDIKVELFCDRPTKTCENFLALCASGYFSGCAFHRNIPNFIVQTGDRTNTGKGGASIWGRKFPDEIFDNLTHNKRGILSMANSGPNTNESQFFFTYSSLPQLDGKYTVFGHILHGLDVLDELEKLPPVDQEMRSFRLTSDVFIHSVTVHANPIADMH
ncbi:peptidyl-prolyl cis-trans isomerase-like 3 [Symsagittifera roscoffensis]|uniref:peptidyl-prolyl cis-trans isomerase-like 3 n=1 Tax=Symsagittifera roscoffensis TaxID=84072 RepID=UPI00307B7973